MAEASGSPSPSDPVADERQVDEPSPAVRQRNPLTTVLVWVGIFTGVVFIAAVLFFWGFFVGRHSYWNHGYDGDRDGRPGNCPMMSPGGMGPGGMGPGGMGPGGMGPGGMGPGGMGPGGMGPGGMGPGLSPSATATRTPGTPRP